jgi:hypothetical protein
LRIKALGGAVLAAAALMVTAGPASAATSVTPSTDLTSPNFTTGTGPTVALTWSGLTAGQTVSLCSKDPGDASLSPVRAPDSTFDPDADCKLITTGLAASGSYNAVLKNPDPTLTAWACGISSDPASAPDQATCWVRFVAPTNSATAGQIGLPVTFKLTPDPVVPEAPFAILLPAGAAAVAGIGYALNRRRRLTMSA